jgi:hypothetical protein
MIIVLTTRGGDRLYLSANGVTKQKARALNVFSKTFDKRVEALKQSEWYLNNGKGCKITAEASPAGALGRPHKAGKRGRPAAKRGPGRPKGSKNKANGKRGPGRPKGSKNKPKVAEVEAAPAAPVEAVASVPVEATAAASA